MKRYLLLIMTIIFPVMILTGQGVQSPGVPIAELFTDFHININDTSKHTGFALNRAYLGYQFTPGGNITAKVIINVGSPEELVAGSIHHRYSFFREASIAWSDQRLTITMGITNTKLFEFQQKFWGKRYVANTYQSINGYGFVADLGMTAEYKVSKKLLMELILMNGEGYNELQIDNNLRTSVAFTITPTDNLAIRILGDIQKKEGLWQPMGIAFIGFKNKEIMIGGEMSYKSNLDLIRGHHAWGISATAGINVAENVELFARYDYSTSRITSGSPLPWNYKKDGSFVVGGVQYSFSPNIKIALDYQGTFPYSTFAIPSDLIYVNALFRF